MHARVGGPPDDVGAFELDGAHVTWGAPIALPPGQHQLVYPSGASVLSRSGPPAGVPAVVVTGAGSTAG